MFLTVINLLSSTVRYIPFSSRFVLLYSLPCVQLRPGLYSFISQFENCGGK